MAEEDEFMEDYEHERQQPRPEFGLPPNVMLDHLKYYGENESMREVAGKIVGDVPARQKWKFFALQNKNAVNANLNEKEVKQSKLRGTRIKMFVRMFTPENLMDIDEIIEQEQIELDYHHRLTQGRGGFGTKQRTTQTQISLQGLMENREDQRPVRRPQYL